MKIVEHRHHKHRRRRFLILTDYFQRCTLRITGFIIGYIKKLDPIGINIKINLKFIDKILLRQT